MGRCGSTVRRPLAMRMGSKSSRLGSRTYRYAATDYGAAVTLADRVGVTILGDFDDINRKLAELTAQGGDHHAEQELLGRLDNPQP